MTGYDPDGYDIRFEHVTFAYREKEDVLRDVSFTAVSYTHLARQRGEVEKGQRRRHRGGSLRRFARQRGRYDVYGQLVRCGDGL